ncbi:hypothetical protein B7463_g1825, partial [Scytalidium lignicola]
MFSHPSAIRKAWLKWKALRLPWRKKFLVGFDLQGNTFWEFRDALSPQSQRMRRIARFPSTVPYSDVSISPQWHQWLRHTRDSPPSLSEQSSDIVRQETLKVLAAEADRRWAAKPSFLDAPEHTARHEPWSARVGNLEQQYHTNEPLRNSSLPRSIMPGQVLQGGSDQLDKESGSRHFGNIQSIRQKRLPEEDPWKDHRDGQREEWQPKAWEANVASPR